MVLQKRFTSLENKFGYWQYTLRIRVKFGYWQCTLRICYYQDRNSLEKSGTRTIMNAESNSVALIF